MPSQPSSSNDASSSAVPSGERPASLSSNLPRVRRGYDPAATDALVAGLTTKQAELEQECARLQEHIAGLEAALSGQQQQEQLVGRTFLAATSFAMRTREDARREAELVLRKAGARAVEDKAALVRLAQDREDAERELLRLRQLTEEMQSGLAGFLKSTLHELRPEGEQEAEADDDTPAPATGIDQTLANALEAALQPEKR